MIDTAYRLPLFVVSNVPAKYRLDVYSRIIESNGLIAFYAHKNGALSHCVSNNTRISDFARVSYFGLFINLIKQSPKTVIAINANIYTLICAIYSKLLNRKFIVWWGGTCQSELHIPKFKKYLRKFIFSLADEFICYSEYTEAYLLQEFNVRSERITVLGNVTMNPASFGAVDPEVNTSQAVRPIRLLAVGNLIERKNYNFLLKVFEQLVSRTSASLELHFVGDGPERRVLEEQVRANGLTGVHFHGELKDQRIVKAYRDADIFVHTATMDQWPQVVNEAMAASLPVVVSSQSGVSETLLAPNHDLFFAPLQIERFCEVLERLISDAALRAEVGANGRAAVERLYRRAIDIFDRYLAANEDTVSP